ncbi:hypothetical protein CP556_24820 [Natrinema sp. CBA1119]|uniref:hypothetical protein n=1 Tax=Natrinema sp. CBA1119 TaxID=1608465 RepID=UPI000BF6608F|nr:hypothetical protein [Natrinema sp. CBA1119]PGF14233.1 hypothetical protein CP556_24820 [Natrinema sp. CBA1119]
MSQTQQPTTTQPALGTDPFADVRDGQQVLKCEDSETGWQWFYTRDGGTVLKFHERDGYEPEATAERVVAATVALADVTTHSVSAVYLEVYAGERV